MKNKILLKNRLREVRNNKGLSRPQVSKLTGISVSTISTWEDGVYTPTIDNLRILADFYNVSLDYIVGRTNNPSVID